MDILSRKHLPQVFEYFVKLTHVLPGGLQVWAAALRHFHSGDAQADLDHVRLQVLAGRVEQKSRIRRDLRKSVSYLKMNTVARSFAPSSTSTLRVSSSTTSTGLINRFGVRGAFRTKYHFLKETLDTCDRKSHPANRQVETDSVIFTDCVDQEYYPQGQAPPPSSLRFIIALNTLFTSMSGLPFTLRLIVTCTASEPCGVLHSDNIARNTSIH